MIDQPMDAHATWEAFVRSFRLADEAVCRECCRELLDWLAKDGSPPSITGIPGFDYVITHAVCVAYLSSFLKGV